MKYLDENPLVEGVVYDIGLQDGKHFPDVVFKGEGFLNHKPTLIFETKDQQMLTINPSYNSYIVESSYDHKHS